ncbi:MAG: hypothetical protein M1475_06325 [Actinobacteria bacterium]|nr:hypothetical protein [Actinomycetota bacterium]
MNWKERIISTIKGKPVDFLPFVPRLDIWYQSNKINNTLPKKYKSFSLKEIVKDLGLGLHTVVPNFRDFLNKDSQGLLGLGIYNLRNNPYKINLNSIDFRFETNKEGLTTSVFYTPYGEITTKILFNKRMESDGATLGHTVEYSIKDINDVKALGYIFERIQVEENYDNFLNFKKIIGDDGISVAFCSLSASPMHHIMKELISFEKFIYELNDHPAQLIELAEKISIFFDKIIPVSIGGEAEAIFLGANYDSFLTWPVFFKNYITPYLKKYSDMAHKSGKFFLTHADGENKGLIKEYIDAGIDIADSICPYPMTKLRIKDIREEFQGKITIWGGIPSICTLEETMNDNEFDKFMDEFFIQIEKGDHLILSFADTTPPAAKFERIEKVAKLAKNFYFRF